MPYLKEDRLKKILDHRYGCKDDSFLYNYVLCHWWNLVLKYLPLWIAPNMITLIGTIGLIFNSILVAYHMPNFIATEETPRWLCLSSAFFLFLYQTLDNIDGKQARKTGTSSPMGELFDHGCDALVVCLMSITTASIGSFGVSWLVIVQTVLAWMTFWCSTWEEYHTGILYLGYISGPEEGLTGLILMFIATYFTGYSIWTTDVKTAFGVSFPGFPNMTVNYVVVAMLMIPVTITFSYSLYTVTRHVRKNEGSLSTAYKHVLSYLIFAACVVTWFHVAPDMWQEYPRTIYYTLGLCFGEMVGRLILAHMCGDAPFALIQRPMVPLLALVAVVVGSRKYGIEFPFSESQAMVVYVMLTWTSYLHILQSILRELSTFLKINILTIPYPPPKKD